MSNRLQAWLMARGSEGNRSSSVPPVETPMEQPPESEAQPARPPRRSRTDRRNLAERQDHDTPIDQILTSKELRALTASIRTALERGHVAYSLNNENIACFLANRFGGHVTSKPGTGRRHTRFIWHFDPDGFKRLCEQLGIVTTEEDDDDIPDSLDLPHLSTTMEAIRFYRSQAIKEFIFPIELVLQHILDGFDVRVATHTLQITITNMTHIHKFSRSLGTSIATYAYRLSDALNRHLETIQPRISASFEINIDRDDSVLMVTIRRK